MNSHSNKLNRLWGYLTIEERKALLDFFARYRPNNWESSPDWMSKLFPEIENELYKFLGRRPI